MKTAAALLAGFAAITLFPGSALAQERVWTDLQGRKLQAELSSFESGTASVKRTSDGEYLEIPFESLSLEDRKHLRSTPEFRAEADRLKIPPHLEEAARKVWQEGLLYFIWTDKTTIDLSAANEGLVFNRLLLGGPNSPVIRLPIKYMARGDDTARFNVTTAVTFDAVTANVKSPSILWSAKGAGGPLGSCEAHWMIDEKVYGSHEAKGQAGGRIALFEASKGGKRISNTLDIQIIFSK